MAAAYKHSSMHACDQTGSPVCTHAGCGGWGMNTPQVRRYLAAPACCQAGLRPLLACHMPAALPHH